LIRPERCRRFAAALKGESMDGGDRPAAGASRLLEPLRMPNLTVKNRIFRSSVAGRFDNYDGSGTQTRINWDLKFARGGVGAIISSNAPVHAHGTLVPGYALIDRDDRIPFWRELVRRVHEHDCKYIVQIVHGGRERLIGGIEFAKGLSSTDKAEPLNGFECERLTTGQIAEIVGYLAAGARRAREAGADGIELAGANGMLFTQFLSPAINTRKDEYGGSLENRARFALEVVRAIRQEVGADFCLGFKISVDEAPRELLPWMRKGNSAQDVVEVCRMLEQAGVDYLHVSAGTGFPHPRNPAGRFPAKDVVKTYDVLISSGRYALRNFVVFRTWPLSVAFRWWWERPHRRLGIEGINLPGSKAVKEAVSIPVLCTGGFQTASVISDAIERGDCDGVTIARPLVANPDLVRHFERGLDQAPRPCTYCNKCLFAFVENPLGCYEERRYDSREQMIDEIYSVYEAAA
jgi:2,4-dienoyl-CoA reductase-like NADH-dependent reductase (Old Yellow Enzyme family)